MAFDYPTFISVYLIEQIFSFFVLDKSCAEPAFIQELNWYLDYLNGEIMLKRMLIKIWKLLQITSQNHNIFAQTKIFYTIFD